MRANFFPVSGAARLRGRFATHCSSCVQFVFPSNRALALSQGGSLLFMLAHTSTRAIRPLRRRSSALNVALCRALQLAQTCVNCASYSCICAALLLAPNSSAGAQERIDVTGPERRAASRDHDGATSVVTGAALHAPGTTVGDVLRAETGASVVETGGFGALATVALRASSTAQVPVYLAGIRLNDELTGVANLSLAPLWLLSRIEVYRGSAPLEALPSAIGGAVYLDIEPPRGTRAFQRGG
jgi:outer membrane receptor protein involved in Fe transport